MRHMSWVTGLLLLLSIIAQLVGVALLPQTDGMTKLLPTIACAAAFVIGIGALARLSHSGIGLGLLLPIMAATVPLISIFIGIFAYGESASPLKLTLLVGACGAIGWASALA